LTDRAIVKLSSERVVGALAKLVGTLEDPRIQLYLFFLEQLRPFSRGELLRFHRARVLQLSPDQVDRALSYLNEKGFLAKRRCGKEALYFPVL
jgi:DNA-binding transcriptional ArsR family regulator